MSAADVKPSVLIITASVGAGHNAAATSLRDALKHRYPASPIDVIDDMTLVPRWFRAAYAGGFNFAAGRAPRLYGLGFRLSDRPDGPARNRRERLRLAVERHALGPLRENRSQTKRDLRERICGAIERGEVLGP